MKTFKKIITKFFCDPRISKGKTILVTKFGH